MAEPRDEQEPPLPPSLRFLKALVTVLTVVMILGVSSVVFLLFTMVGSDTRPVLVHPEDFAIPEGVGTTGYSVVDGYTVIVGDDGMIRVFASDTRELVQEIEVGSPVN
ncbi:hypothetical protein HKCCE4037_17805 [Rhodobacterales bacterium HKCCE4037]|nr:hypothetical protein [Rhodobacterales bacterium HKCCE4037]